MKNEYVDAAVNGIFGKVVLLDDGRRLLFKRVFAEGLLEIDCLREHKQFKVVDPLTGELRIPDVSWLEEMLAQGRIQVLDAPPTAVPADLAALDMDREQILAKDPYAEVRRDFLRAIAEVATGGDDPKMGSIKDRIWNERFQARVEAIALERPDVVRMTCPEISTIRTWLRKLDPMVATLAQVMNKTGLGSREPRLDPEVIEALQELQSWYYDDSGRRQVDALAEMTDLIAKRNAVRAEGALPPLDCPSKETVRRYINAGLNRDSYARKFGEAAARSRWDGQGQPLNPTKILAIGLIDDTVLDAVTVFDADRCMPAGRPWLTVIMDVYSRCILGWMLDFVPPNHHTAAEVIRRANRPKQIRPEMAARYPVLQRINGKLDRLIADNGTGFASASFQQVCADLGITLQLAAVGSPRHKAMLERFFYTLKTYLLEKLPGYTFTPALLREFNIDPEKQAALTLTELQFLISEFVNAYHVTVHSALGVQPANKWQMSMEAHGRDMILDETRIDINTGVTLHGRRLYRGGIRLFGLTFHDAIISRHLNDELVGAEPHNRRVKSGATVATVRIKYNPANLRCVWVWNHVSNRWVELPCVDQAYADGLTLWQHRQIKDWAKRKSLAFNSVEERLDARRQLNDLILELAPEMRPRERRAVARMTGQSAAGHMQVTLEEAEPTHHGMGPIIEHQTNEMREDADIKPDRPGVGTGKSKSQSNQEEQDLGDEDETHDGDDKQDLDIGEAQPPIEGSDDDDDRFREFE